MTAEELCALYAAKVSRFASLAAAGGHEAEDIAQDALIKAIAALPRYDLARGSMDAWLWRIVVNTARDATRAERVRRALVDRLRPAVELEAHVEDAAIERTTVAELYASITRLAPRDRELLALRFGSELSTAEVGSVVGLSAESARRAIGRALDRLRATVGGGVA